MKLLLLAGEESGVLYAERIAGAVRGKDPSVEIRGYGDYGFETSDLAVIGLFAVLRKILYFLRVKQTMERAIDEWRPDVVCTVDYPGLNLKLAAYAKKRGIRAVHVVCPQVWAWKKGRIPKIEASLDKLCCFFPFEPALFKPGFAEFVGHPLVDEMRDDLNTEARRHREGDEKVLAILPGSRIGEIEKHLPTLLETVQKLQQSPCLRASVLKSSRISSTNGWPTNSANPGLKSAGSNGKKQQSLSSDASIFGIRPFFHAQTCGHTTCTARIPRFFA